MVHLAILLQQNNQALSIQIWLFSLKLIFKAKSVDVIFVRSIRVTTKQKTLSRKFPSLFPAAWEDLPYFKKFKKGWNTF